MCVGCAVFYARCLCSNTGSVRRAVAQTYPELKPDSPLHWCQKWGSELKDGEEDHQAPGPSVWRSMRRNRQSGSVPPYPGACSRPVPPNLTSGRRTTGG